MSNDISPRYHSTARARHLQRARGGPTRQKRPELRPFSAHHYRAEERYHNMTSFTRKLYNANPAAAEDFYRQQQFEHKLTYGKQTQLAGFGLRDARVTAPVTPTFGKRAVPPAQRRQNPPGWQSVDGVQLPPVTWADAPEEPCGLGQLCCRRTGAACQRVTDWADAHGTNLPLPVVRKHEES
jgi:hypothetical protein